MPIGVWLSLAFLIVVSTLSLVSLFRAGIRLWRTFRSFGRQVDDTMAAVAASAERLASSSAGAGVDAPRLATANERLRVTLARLGVLRAAVQDVQHSLAAVAAYYPRK